MRERGFKAGPVLRAVAVATVWFVVIVADAPAAEPQWLVANTARARALAMGSATSSLEDDFTAGLYNPAAFRINATRSERPFRIFFNPAGAAAAFNDYSEYDAEYHEDGKLTEGEALQAASMLVKGAVLSTSALDIGFALNEPLNLSDSVKALPDRFITAEQVTAGVFHTLFANVKIASSVSIGVSGTLFRTRENGKDAYRTGHSFGVLLDPSPRMKVGVAYTQMPEELEDTRMELERIGSGTVTGGVSYYPDQKTLISVDIRNMNRDDEPASREIHAGAERVVGSRLALRGGYFRRKDTNRDIYSCGIGILPGWERISKYRYSTRNDLFSYSFIAEAGENAKQWHVLSLLVKF